MQVEHASESELPAFIELLGAWLWSRGIHQWKPGSARSQARLLGRYLLSGDLLLAKQGGELAGGCIVTREPTVEWSFATQPSAYLHKLAVSRSYAGEGLGDRLIEQALDWSCVNDLPRLCLDCWDCWDGNEVLKRYYRSQGFEELQAVPSNGYRVRLFQLASARGSQ